MQSRKRMVRDEIAERIFCLSLAPSHDEREWNDVFENRMDCIIIWPVAAAVIRSRGRE